MFNTIVALLHPLHALPPQGRSTGVTCTLKYCTRWQLWEPTAMNQPIASRTPHPHVSTCPRVPVSWYGRWFRGHGPGLGGVVGAVGVERVGGEQVWGRGEGGVERRGR